MLGLQAPDQIGKPANGGNALPSLQAAQDSRTVLVIDDEVALLAIIADVLEESGYKVLTVPDGPAGLDIVRSEQPIDLLITDPSATDEEIRADISTCPVIYETTIDRTHVPDKTLLST